MLDGTDKTNFAQFLVGVNEIFTKIESFQRLNKAFCVI